MSLERRMKPWIRSSAGYGLKRENLKIPVITLLAPDPDKDRNSTTHSASLSITFLNWLIKLGINILEWYHLRWKHRSFNDLNWFLLLVIVLKSLSGTKWPNPSSDHLTFEGHSCFPLGSKTCRFRSKFAKRFLGQLLRTIRTNNEIVEQQFQVDHSERMSCITRAINGQWSTQIVNISLTSSLNITSIFAVNAAPHSEIRWKSRWESRGKSKWKSRYRW